MEDKGQKLYEWYVAACKDAGVTAEFSSWNDMTQLNKDIMCRLAARIQGEGL